MKVPRAASEQFDLMVPESPFSSQRRPLISGQRWRVIWCFKSNSTSGGITKTSSVNPHLANSRSTLLSESIVELSISIA